MPMFVEAATDLREIKSGVTLLWKAPKAYDSHRDKLLRRIDAETEHSWVAKKVCFRWLGLCGKWKDGRGRESLASATSTCACTTTSEGEIGGGPVSAIEGQLQETVDVVMRKVSFKLSKRGTRYRPKPKPNPSSLGFVDDEVDDTTSSVFKLHHHHQLIPARVQCDYDFSKKRLVVDLTEDDDDEDIEEIPDADVSFIVNIFPDGYTIDKSLKSNAAQQIASMYYPKLLRPYDRTSQSLFTAIKCCRVPANFFEDIPCTYKNGKVACEVRDWRKDSAEPAGVSINGPSIAATPSIRRISLRMSVDSIVRDIPQMSKRDFWAYSELLEAEAKILLALYPKLDLDSYPNFDRLCKYPTAVKLNLDFRAMRRKRLRQMSVPEKSNLRTDPNVANPATQNVGPPNSVNLATQNVRQIPTMHQLTQDVRQLPRMDQLTQNTSIPKFQWVSHQPEDQFGASGTAFNAPGASSTHALVNLSSGNDGINSIMSAFEGGRGNQDSLPSSSMANSDHRNRSNPLSFVGNQQQKIASHNALGASSTHAMPSASSNQDHQSSFMANSNNRNWSDPLALIGNHQQMTLEILDNTPGTAFNASRASNTRRRSFVSAFDGRTANQDDQSSFPMAFLDGRRSRSNSLVFLGNQQQQQLPSHMHYNPARTAVNASGASSSHGMMNLNSNNGGIISSSLVNMDNRNWSNPLADVVNQHQLIPLHNQNTSGTTAFSAPGASSTHGMISLNSNNDGISSIIPFDDGKTGNQDGRLSSVANLDNRNQSNPLVYVGYQQPKIEPYMPDNDDLSSILFGLDGKSGNQDGQSSFMAIADNRNQSNPLAIVGNQQQQITSYMQNNTSSQTAANVPGGSSTQGTVSLSSDDDIDIRAILSAFEGNVCSPMANNADNNQQQLIAANQQHGIVSSGSDDDDLWSFMSAFDNKRGDQDGQSSSMAKRNRLNPSPFNGNQLQQMAGSSSHMDNSNAPDSRWKNMHQSTGGVIQQPNAIGPTQKQHRYQMLDAISSKPNIGQQGIRHNIKQEPLEIGRDSDRLHPSFPPQLTRSTFVQAPWNKKSPSPVNITVKEEPVEFSSGSMEMQFGAVGSSRRKRSVVASVPAIGGRRPIEIITIEDDEPVQRRPSSRPPKSGEFSIGATRRQYRAAARSSSQTERSVVNSVPAVGGSRSSSSNTNNSMHPTQMAATLGSKPLPTIPILSGIRSSSTIGNTSGLSNVSASVQRELDRRTQDRFTKIGLLTARYKINCKELKVDDYKPTINIPSSQLNHALINSNDNETLIDETCKMPLSMSHAGGNVNLCKTRILKFVKEAHSYRAGNEEILVPRSETKLILSERQSDGTVTMHYCEFDDYDHSAEEELLPTFPNTHTADMFAAEFCSLMERECYTIAGDYLQAKPVSVVQLSDVQCKRAFGPAVIAGKPYPVGTSNASLGTGRNIGGGNCTVGGQGLENDEEEGCSRAGRMGASPLAIFDPNPMEINQGSTISTASIRRASIVGRSRGKSSNAGGSQGGNLQVPSGAGSGSGSRGRGSRGRGSRGQGSRGRRSDITPGRQPRMALSKPSALGDLGSNLVHMVVGTNW
ncbi:hypothetical protein Tco_1125114 [Tanacetum coccineum]|uniref:Uncharacterized protein n=1 Tax=Tanacetum coccineum TaxID=301880 RepID=A0ABQ5JC49_9ASTR